MTDTDVDDIGDVDDNDNYLKVQQHTFISDLPILLQYLSQPYIDITTTQLINAILNKYQENSKLLDIHLLEFVKLLLDHIYTDIHNNTILHTQHSTQQLYNICKILYTLCKIRGYKTVLLFLTHSVSDLEVLINLLHTVHIQQTTQQSNVHIVTDTDIDTNWETNYILLLWLCIVILVPFNLAIVDSTITDTVHNNNISTDSNIFQQLQQQTQIPSTGIIHRLLWLCLQHMSQTGVQHNAAALLLARVMSRSDIPSNIFIQYIEYCCTTLNTSYNAKSTLNTFLTISILTSLFELLKLVQRTVMLQQIDKLMTVLTQHNWLSHNNTLIRKLIVKITQRCGLIYLIPKLASWRYERGQRELFDKHHNNSGTAKTVPTTHTQHTATIDDTQDDVPTQVEELIGILLDGLSDTDTVVRWSAAKGLGRITMCLSAEFCTDIIQSVIDLLKPYNSDCIWHGCMLALAELARRGLLLPNKLDTIVPLVLQGLVYDIRQGQYSIGANVRDSACYVIWAFARAYQPSVIKPYVNDIAHSLLPIAVYDKEINVRRAACAAYQENVGRQGSENWPCGIEINTAADYFTVTNRTESYCSIALYVAQYEQYNIHLVNHLVEYKLKHWSKEIRCLASTALSKLCTVNNTAQYIITTVLPQLHVSAHSGDICERHGSVIAIADIITVLHTHNIQVDTTMYNSIVQLIPELDKLNLLGNAGGAIMREAVCYYIIALSQCNTILSTDMLQYYEQHINNNISHPNDTVCALAVQALHIFATTYYIQQQLHNNATIQIQKYLKCMLYTPNVQQTRGITLAVAALPIQLIQPIDNTTATDTLQQVLNALILNTTVVHQTDPETRRNAVKSIVDITIQLNDIILDALNTNVIDPAILQKQQNDKLAAQYAYRNTFTIQGTRIIDHVFNTLLLCCDDYSIDNRGDIGSIVRQQAIQSMAQLLLYLSNTEYNVLNNELILKCINAILKQLCEKLDKLRSVVADCLLQLLRNRTLCKLIPHSSNILPTIVDNTDNIVYDLSSSQLIFNNIVPLLQYNEYRYSILSGLVISIGGLTEITAITAQNALIRYINSITTEQLYTLSQCIIEILTMYKGHTRVIIPTFKTIAYLFTNNIFEPLITTHYNFATQLYKCLLSEITKSTQINKIQCSCNIFIQLLSLIHNTQDTQYIQLIKTVGLLLTHRYPVVRKHTAKLLFDYCTTVELLLDVDTVNLFTSEQLQSINSVLNSIQWDTDNMIEIRYKRDEISKLFGVQPTVTTVKETYTEEKQNVDVDNTYASFIDSMR